MLHFRNVQHKMSNAEGPRPHGEISGVQEFGHSMVKMNALWRSSNVEHSTTIVDR
jgi:hypothetical protein